MRVIALPTLISPRRELCRRAKPAWGRRKLEARVFRKAGGGKSACPVCRGGGAKAPPYSTVYLWMIEMENYPPMTRGRLQITNGRLQDRRKSDFGELPPGLSLRVEASRAVFIYG